MTCKSEENWQNWSALKSIKHDYNYENHHNLKFEAIKIKSVLIIDIISDNELYILSVENPVFYKTIIEIIATKNYYEFDNADKINIFNSKFLFEIKNSDLIINLLSDNVANSIYNNNNELKLKHISVLLSEQIIDIVCGIDCKINLLQSDSANKNK